MNIQTLSEAETFLYERLPVFQNAGKVAYKPGLERILALLEQLNNPQKKTKCIHVAGTNGKGSTCSAIAACLMSAGYKVGLFTSPHFLSFTERIKINQKPVNEAFACRFLNQYGDNDLGTSYFELLTAMGFAYFAEEGVDVAVIEVGLGGRLDSTNVCQPILSAITSIGLDHCDILGDSLEKIAVEKAGIKKEGVPLVVAPITDGCKAAIQEVYGEQDITFLNGHAEVNNNMTVVKACLTVLENSFPQLKTIDTNKSLENHAEITQLQGRFQRKTIGDKTVVLDVAHNPPALKLLFDRVQKELSGQTAFLMGFSSDKDIESLRGFFPEGGIYVASQASVLRAKPEEDTRRFFLSENLQVITFLPKILVADVLAELLDYKGIDSIVVCGSFFIVADALNFFKENEI